MPRSNKLSSGHSELCFSTCARNICFSMCRTPICWGVPIGVRSRLSPQQWNESFQHNSDQRSLRAQRIIVFSAGKPRQLPEMHEGGAEPERRTAITIVAIESAEGPAVVAKGEGDRTMLRRATSDSYSKKLRKFRRILAVLENQMETAAGVA